MAWVLTRGLTTVRAEFNTVFPGRDKTSDGSVGDLAHQQGPSGHNPDITGRPEYADGDSKDEVRAIDVDRDLVPGSSVDWMERVIQYLVNRARSGGYIPFRYMIYKGRIWSRSDGWQTREYTGENKHDKHAHFSGDYTQTADEWTGSLGLVSLTGEEDSMFTKYKASGDVVRYLQYRLHNLGYDVGTVDGDYGDKTAAALAAAVKAFNAKVIDGKTYGPAETIYLDILWTRKYGTAGPAGPAGPVGKTGPAGPTGPQGPAGTLSGGLTVIGGSLQVIASPTAR